MKTFTALYIFLVATLWCCVPNQDSVKQAQEQNKNSAIDKDISKFMTEAADARMMDIEGRKAGAGERHHCGGKTIWSVDD
jgi:hypothetical protein